MKLYSKAIVEKVDKDEFTAVASTEVEDRHGDIVEQSGWDLKNFKVNPILLFMHDSTKPLGKATRIWIDRASGQAKLMFKGFISTATDYGRAAKQLMEEGILNSFSVGFRALETDENRITKAELHEISLVTLPANPEARRLAYKTLQESGIEEKVIKDFGLFPEESKRIQELEEELIKVREIAELAVKGLQHLNPQRSKREVATKRLELSKVIAKAADKLIVEQPKAVSTAKIIKRSSEMLIRSHKGDL